MEYSNINPLRGKQSPLDKHGTCPSCNTNWDAGDILDSLARLNVFSGKTLNDVAKVANSYGWTQLNQARFSNVVITIFPPTPERLRELTFYTCPKCMSTFEITGGHRFDSIIHAKREIDSLFTKNSNNNGSDNNQLLDNDQEQATEGLAVD